MKKAGKLIVKYKWAILALTAVVIALSAWGTVELITGGKINSDMMSYLPDEFETTKGLEFLRKNFNINGDAMIVVEGTGDDEDLRQRAESIRQMEGVSRFVWVEDILKMDSFKSVIDWLDLDITIDTAELAAFLKHPIEGEEDKYNYVFLIMMDYSPSTKEAFNLLDDITAQLKDRNMASAGMTHTAQTVMLETLQTLPTIIIYACLSLIAILFLTTPSYIEPLILMVSLGISVLVNMGSNIFFPSVSIISFATSSILQLALTMDYAVFYMHIYREKRRFFDKTEATLKAIPEVASSIVASAFTTIGGFLALYFMRFELGADLANVLMKGVFLSLLSVIILQPIFVLLFDKLLLKTQHKELRFNPKSVARFAVKERFLVFIAALMLIVPLYMGQSRLTFSYYETYEQKLDTPQQQLAYELGNQLIFAVPLFPKEGKTHAEYIEEIKKEPKVSGVMGAFSAMRMSEETLREIVEDDFKRKFLTSGYAQGYFKEVDKGGGEKTWYTLYTIGIKGSAEDEDASRCFANLSRISSEYFDNVYQIGMLVGINDIKEVTPSDFLWVTVVSMAIILVILILLFRSFRKGLLLVLVIELGIWINLCLSFLLDQRLNFMVYIMISSVQLGCTVDYAILAANRFEEIKWQYTKRQDAAFAATASTFPAIATSAAILLAACMSMYLGSGNLIIKQLTGMLARGAVISAFLVLALQTGIMVYFRGMKSFRETVDAVKTKIQVHKAKKLRKKAKNQPQSANQRGINNKAKTKALNQLK